MHAAYTGASVGGVGSGGEGDGGVWGGGGVWRSLVSEHDNYVEELLQRIRWNGITNETNERTNERSNSRR